MRLTVTDFSCIKSAELELAPFTLLVGPQASGKSVLSRLVYFFYDLLPEQFASIEDLRNFNEYKNLIREKFKKWFPPGAWGPSKFMIEFAAGAFQVKIARTDYRGTVSSNVRVWCSGFIEDAYKDAEDQLNQMIKDSQKKEATFDQFEYLWRVHEATRKKYESQLGPEFAQNQLFVPAGRSFFTSIGKAIAAFEQSGAIDPLVIRFGRLVAAVRDRYQFNLRRTRLLSFFDKANMELIFGGKILIERDKEYVQTPDGREVPFAFLSSGQQELLPLWLALDAWGVGRRDHSRMLYIEEPEAHLFPTAQGAVVEQLVRAINRSRGSLRLLVTTHSPYVLSKINNLIKAGHVGSIEKDGIQKAVAKIISTQGWLGERAVSAYALYDGRLASILDEEGFIDGSYLDDVSGGMAREYSALLELEIRQ